MKISSKIFFRLRRPNFACAFFVKFYVERNSPHLPIRPESRERAAQSAEIRIIPLSEFDLRGPIAPLPGLPTPGLRFPSSSASKTTLGSILHSFLSATSAEKLISQVPRLYDLPISIKIRPRAQRRPGRLRRPNAHLSTARL